MAHKPVPAEPEGGSPRRIDRLDWALFALIVVLAALPRLAALDLAEFKLDEATHYQMAYAMTQGKWVWFGSTASVGVPKPPLFVLVLALPMLMSRDPYVVTGFIGLLGALSAGGLYLILRRRLFGRAGALGAALCFVANPQAVLLGRKLFTADLLPPLTTLYLAALVALLSCPPARVRRTAAGAALVLALLVLTTFSPLLLAPVLAIGLWLRRRDLRMRGLLQVAAIGTLPLLPYAWHAAPFLPRVLASDPSTTPVRVPLLRWVWNLFYGAPWPTNMLSIGGLTTGALALLSVLGLTWFLQQQRDRGVRRIAILLLTWLAGVPLLALAAPVQLERQYLVVLYPVLFVLPGAGIELLATRRRQAGYAGLALVALTTAWQATLWVRNLQDVRRGVQAYGTPLGYWRNAAATAQRMAEENGADEILLLMPGDQSWDEKAHILTALLGNARHRPVDGRSAAVYPAHPALLFIASEAEQALASSATCTDELIRPFPASPFGDEYHVRLWRPESASRLMAGMQPATAEWCSGARLLGYRVDRAATPGDRFQATLLWQTRVGPIDADIHWFHHLLDANQKRLGQHDQVGWPAGRWLPGDMVVTWIEIPVPTDARDGAQMLRVGQYTYPDIQPISTVDDHGNPAGSAIDIPVHTETSHVTASARAG